MSNQAEYAERRREGLRVEVQKDLAAAEAYAEQHGSFTDLVREHYVVTTTGGNALAEPS
jgi:hypothetical protein